MKTYIVTDPCYILSSNDWDRMGENDNWCENIVRCLESITKSNAWCFPTGYGDWVNCLLGAEVHDDHMHFTADAGLVCVCEYTDEVKYNVTTRNNIPDHCFALVDIDGDVEVIGDTSDPDWTTIKLTNGTQEAHSV